ncbi:hypothetical protein LLG95_11980 [bacterium]|nr:hypothetical protein [bacterium]
MVKFCLNVFPIRRIVLAVVLIFACAAQAFPAESVQQINDRGLAMMKAGNYAAAAEAFATARRVIPQDANLQRNLALAYNAWGVELAKESKFEQALERLETAHELLPTDKLVTANMTAMRINWATELMDNKKHDEAESQLVRADADAATDDQHREIAKRRAYNVYTTAEEALAKGNRERTRKLLAGALEIDPDCTHAQLKMAEMLYEEGDTASALEYWRAAAAIDPNIPGLSAMLEKAVREEAVEGNFDQRTSREFKVSYEGKVNEQTAGDAIKVLSRGLFQIRRDLRYDAKHPFAVVLYSRESYDIATAAPGWSSGLYDGKIRVPLKNEIDSKALTTTLRHELTHAVVIDLAGPKVPAWLNEGLAMYYERDIADRDARARADRRAIAKLIRNGEQVSVLTLPPSFTKITDTQQVERAYLLSRSFVQWLAARYRPWKLRELLVAIGANTPLGDAVKKVYGRDIETLEKLWLDSMTDAA